MTEGETGFARFGHMSSVRDPAAVAGRADAGGPAAPGGGGHHEHSAAVDERSATHCGPRPGTASATFADRHIGPDADGMATMLHLLDQPDLDALEAAAVPAIIRSRTPLNLPEPASETETLAELRALAAKNRPLVQMIGLGYHDTITPGVIKRNVLENPAWYTAYTPYQPEISQGRLEALLNFQTAVSDLTGLDIANASMLDEATAAAEAMTLIKRTAKSKSQRFVVDADTLPQTIAVIQTRAEPIGIEVVDRRPVGRRRIAAGRRLLRAVAVLSGRVRCRPRPSRADRGRPPAGGQGRRRHRPAGADPAAPARRDRRRRRGRVVAAVRGAARFRRPARRVPRGAQRDPAAAARPAGRGVP